MTEQTTFLSWEEVKRRYFPWAVEEEQRLLEDDPAKLGKRLADETIAAIRKALEEQK